MRLRICYVCIAGAPVTSSGFFFHPSDQRYGASPDGIGQSFLLEVKTRAINSSAPLESVTGPHIIQSNFQMACTGGKVTFLESYLPEHNIANAFLVKHDNLVFDVCKAMTDHIFEKKIVTCWPHEERNLLKKLGEQVLGKVPTFESLRPLRSWINAMAKHRPAMRAEPTKCWFVSKRKQASRA